MPFGRSVHCMDSYHPQRLGFANYFNGTKEREDTKSRASLVALIAGFSKVLSCTTHTTFHSASTNTNQWQSGWEHYFMRNLLVLITTGFFEDAFDSIFNLKNG